MQQTQLKVTNIKEEEFSLTPNWIFLESDWFRQMTENITEG